MSQSEQENDHDLSVRRLVISDIPELLRLENEKWGPHGATREMLASRLAVLEGYSWGAFREDRLVSSLFCMRKNESTILNAKTWAEACDNGLACSHDVSQKAVFGISLSGSDLKGTRAILSRLALALECDGVGAVYLGTPLPRLGDWLDVNPDGDPASYTAMTKRFPDGRRLPVDPQLSYYYQLGFRTVVAVRPRYFPHERSRDWAAVIRHTVNHGAL